MGQLNKNNFLIWNGEFNDLPFSVVANTDNVELLLSAFPGLGSVDAIMFLSIYPLANDVASYGINKNTFEFTVQDNPGNPATFDAVSGEVKYYLPDDLAVGEIRVLKYKWKDNFNHTSNEGTINIQVLQGPTGWRGWYGSYACETVMGNNTGNAMFGELEKYYLPAGGPVLPAVRKPNVDTDPDYIPPFPDLISCPLPGTIRLQGFNDGTSYTITRIRIWDNTMTLEHDFNGLTWVGDIMGQPYEVYVNPGTGKTMEVTVEGPPFPGIPPSGGTLQLNPAAGGSAAQALPFADFTSPPSQVFTFASAIDWGVGQAGVLNLIF